MLTKIVFDNLFQSKKLKIPAFVPKQLKRIAKRRQRNLNALKNVAHVKITRNAKTKIN